MSNKSKDADPKQPDSSFIQLTMQSNRAPLRTSAPRRKALLGVLTAACTILIVVSLGFVHPSTSGAWSIDWIIQTVTGESVVTKDTKVSGSTTTSGEASSKDSKSSNDAKDESKHSDESKSKDDSESSNKESDKSSDGKKSEDQDGKKSGDKSAAQNTGAGDTSNASGGGQSSDGASSSNGGNASSGGQSGSQESSYVTVTVSVTSSAVGNPVSSGGTFTFNEGATVYDALCALGLSVNAHGSSYGTYVSAIGGLAEKQYQQRVAGCTPSTAHRP